MINENDMHIDQFDVNMKVSKIIAKFASSAKKYNATDCIKALVGNIYKSCAGEHADLNVISLLKGADYISSFLTEEEFREAFSYGYTEPWQLSEYFDLPQREIECAYHYWTDCRGVDFNK